MYSANITDLWPVTGAKCSETSSLWALVQNDGSAALPVGAKVWFWAQGPGFSGSFVGETSVAGLASGASAWYKYDWTIPGSVSEGTFEYWARVYHGSTGISDWEGPQYFEVECSCSLPAAATLVSPSGTIADNTPTYTWNAVDAATWYYLWVNGPSGNVIKQWYTAASVCSGSTCSVTHSTELDDGDHTWWIRTWNSCGYGPWSEGMDFKVEPCILPGKATLVSPSGSISDNTPAYTWNAVSGGGFDSQFNGNADGWEVHSGSWWIDSNAWYTTQGLSGVWSSVSYAADFTNFDYQARLWRDGSDGSANSILIRGTPTPLGSGNLWYSYYAFQYTRDGSYSVWKRVAGTSTCLQSWTASSAINQGSAWNTLRVVANGGNLYYYINGTLVWSGSDFSLSSGRVGIRMHRSSSSTGDQLWADWATLTEGEFEVTETVSDEQQALNEAANEHPRGSEDVGPSAGGASLPSFAPSR